MSKIAFIIPYPEMAQTIHKAWEMSEAQALECNLYPGKSFEYSIITYTHKSSLSYVETDADVLVARGATALGLKQLYLHQNKHVIEVPVTASDLVGTIRRAVNRYGNLPVAITGTFNMTYGSGGVLRSDMYSARLYHSDQVDDKSYEEMVDRAKADGCKIIIGGVHTTEYARTLGLFGEPLSSSAESFLQAISNAKAAAVIAEKERSRAALNQTIINSIDSGILACTPDGSIAAINLAAREMLELGSKSALSLDKLGLSKSLYRLLSRPDAFEDTVAGFKNKALIVNKKLLSPDGEGSISLITLRPAERAAAAPQESQNLAETEARMIIDALSKCGMSRTEAAAALGMSRTTLWRKMKTLGIN